MSTFQNFLFVLTSFAVLQKNVAEQVLVETDLGKLAGYKYETTRGDIIYTFEGIPYAKPPVGDLRFKSPLPPENWTGVKSAEKPGNSCPSLLFGGDEDCLHLSVYTPQKPSLGQKIPVMVWIPGGGFTAGNSLKSTYGPEYLVPRGVIIVSVNYRVGALGFLSLQTPECPGNYGLKDQNLALRWVRDHIANFGGDPDNVTLFGQSAGGASVLYHLLSPMSKGLFHRAIAMSGAATSRWAYSRYPQQSAMLLAKKLGEASDDPKSALATLRAASVKDILENTQGIFDEVEGSWPPEAFKSTFVPTAEPEGTPDAFITKTPRDMVASGDFNDVPFVTGVTDAEAAFAVTAPDYLPPGNDDFYQTLLLKEFEPELGSEKALEAAKKLRQFYFPDGLSQEGFVKAISANVFAYGAAKAAAAVATKKKAPTYLYIFTGQRKPSMVNLHFNISYPGTSHGYDVEFMWWVNGPITLIDPASNEGKISDNICKLWTEFAKTGHFETDWPAVEDENQLQYLHIGEELQVGNEFFGEEIKLWDDITEILKK